MKTNIAAALVIALAVLGACKGPSISDEIEKQEHARAADMAKDKVTSDAFLAQNKARAGVITTASGLQYEVLRKGNAKLPTPGPQDEVTVMYEGRLINGFVFDSSYARGQPATFDVGGVIPGWTEAIQLMHPGDAFGLVLPPEIGYAMEEKPNIPPNSVLVFKVELLGFQRPDGTIVKAK